jgi:hypothetical protein
MQGAMLTPLRLTPVQVDRTKYLPPLLLELVEAAEIGGDLVPAVLAIVRKLGFDGFLYATASYHLRPNNDERIHYFTTLPRDWVTATISEPMSSATRASFTRSKARCRSCGTR